MAWSKALIFTDPYPCQAAIRAPDLEIFPITRKIPHRIGADKHWMQRSYENRSVAVQAM
jgi:hypothetical protein